METKSIRVLLVEDNPGDARLIREMLVKADGHEFDITWVTRLSQGLDNLSRGEADVVLLDLGLPDSRGLDTFVEAYAHSPTMPFVILTGLADETIALTAVGLGAQDYLIKGEVNGKLLLRAIRYATERKRVELALEAERKKLYAVLNSLPAFVHLKKADFTIHFANRRFTEIFGEPGNRRCYEVLTGRSEPCEHCRALEVLTIKAPQKFEWTSSLNARTYKVYNYPFCHEEDLQVLTLGIDITERKRAEEALRETRNYLENLIDFANAPIIVWDLTFKITRFNHAFENLTGYPAAEVLGQELDMLFPEASREESLSRIAQTLSGEYWKSVEIPILRKDGDVRIALWNSANIYAEDGKTLLATIAQGQDITERKQAEESLEASKRFLEIAYRHTAMTPLLEEFVAEVKRFTGCSAVGIRILGDNGDIPYEAFDGFSRQFYELESPLSVKSEQCMCINVIKGTADPKLPFYTKAGSFYMNYTTRFLATVSPEDKGKTRNVCNEFGYESVALAPLHVGNRILGLIHVADPEENMVPLRKVEDLERVAVYLGTALERLQAEDNIHALSHELMRAQEYERQKISRELHDSVAQELAALKIGLENLQSDLPGKPVGELSLRFTELSEKLQETLNSIRNLSYDLRPPDLEHFGLVQAIKLHCEEVAARTGLQIDFRAAGIEAAHLDYAAAINLYRIIQEGLTNVERHARATKVNIRLVASFPKIILRLEDNGQGFEVIEQEASAAREKRMGLLGMKERVALLGGQMSIESQLKKGTKITIEIPWNGEGLDSKEAAPHR